MLGGYKGGPVGGVCGEHKQNLRGTAPLHLLNSIHPLHQPAAKGKQYNKIILVVLGLPHWEQNQITNFLK